jgi:hypothetical protein
MYIHAMFCLIITAAQRPFKVTFKTDSNKMVTNANIVWTSETFAGATAPAIAGIVGFSLGYWQLNC